MIIFPNLGHLGRLGNQNFQIAATLAHASKMKTQAQFPAWSFKNYFNKQVDDSFINQGGLRINGVEYTQHFSPFHYQPLPEQDNLLLTGFFQSEKYFKDHWEDIRPYFFPSANFFKVVRETGGHLLNMQDTVAIHVRRGDYFETDGRHPVLTYDDYYHKAINHFLIERSMSCTYLVFSEDMEWCKKNFRGNCFHFMEGNSAIVDLYLMAMCRHHIIANSSFSWWGSYLSRLFHSTGHRITVAPSTWFGEQVKYNTDDLYCEGWVRI